MSLRTRRDLEGLGAASGFSLIEILLVVGIIGLLSGIAFVDYSGLLTFERLKATGRKIGGYCERARAQAVSLQRSCLLEVDFVHSRYRFLPDPARDRFGRFINPDTEEVMTDEELADWNAGFEWEDLPRDVYFVDVQVSAIEKYDERHQSVSIRYPPDGTVDPFIVHLKSGPGDLFSVSVTGLTGVAECDIGRTEFPAAEASHFSSVMGNQAPGQGSSKDNKKNEKTEKDKKSGDSKTPSKDKK